MGSIIYEIFGFLVISSVCLLYVLNLFGIHDFSDVVDNPSDRKASTKDNGKIYSIEKYLEEEDDPFPLGATKDEIQQIEFMKLVTGGCKTRMKERFSDYPAYKKYYSNTEEE